MKASEKESFALSPLMQTSDKRKNVAVRLIGAISSARAREWIRHIKKLRREWK